MTKAKIIFFCLFLFHSLSWGQRANETYPNKPIRLIVPLAAGSSVDTAARIVMQKVSQNIGQSIIIENKLGAAGIIGADQVAKSAPDGYTLGGFNDSIITMIPNLNPKLPWDIVKDFESISQVAIIEWGLMVSSSSPYRNVNDLIEAAKKSPGKLNYRSGGNGGPQHIGLPSRRQHDACAIQGCNTSRCGRSSRRGGCNATRYLYHRAFSSVY
jgi:tripartite-type tricarboxylate transporter receptor subunit TctC